MAGLRRGAERSGEERKESRARRRATVMLYAAIYHESAKEDQNINARQVEQI